MPVELSQENRELLLKRANETLAVLEKGEKIGPMTASYAAIVIRALLQQVAPSSEPPGGELELHPETASLVQRFARALADKLATAERKYGYSDGWLADDWEAECRRQLHHHAAKGDPRDVAAYAAFCWHHGWSTALPEALSASRSEPPADLQKVQITPPPRELEEAAARIIDPDGWATFDRQTAELRRLSRQDVETGPRMYVERSLSKARSILALPPQEGWRDISTAPKDGTIIDVWRPEGGRDTVFWGFPHHECGEMGSLCDDDWHRIRAPGWVCATFNEFLGRNHAPFTHWMPLPASPTTQADGAGHG